MFRRKGASARVLGSAICIAIVALMPAACQQFGPDAVERGRQRYNDTIHETSREQLFANLVRIANGDSPLFMDVTEVDAAQLIQGSITGGASGIGGSSALQGAGPAAVTGVTNAGTTGALLTKIIGSTVGSVGGTVGVQEAPTIRYQPLLGNALIQQISTPIVAGSIANLITSDWPFLPVLDLTTDSMTPDYEDNWAALNAIASLNTEYAALVITAGKSDANRPDDSPKKIATGTAITIDSSPKDQQGNDALVLYLEPRHPNIDSVLAINHDSTSGKDVQSINDVEGVSCFGDQAIPSHYTIGIPPPGPDLTKPALVIAQRNILHLWIGLLRLYEDTQVVGGGVVKLKDEKIQNFNKKHPELAVSYSAGKIDDFYAALDRIVGSLPADELNDVFEVLPRRLELRTAAVSDTKKAAGGNATDRSKPPPPKNIAPVMITHSALGTLNYAVGHDTYGVEFVTPAAYQKITAHKWNKGDFDPDFYTLLYDDLGSTCTPDSTARCYRSKPPKTPTRTCVSNWIQNTDPDEVRKASGAVQSIKTGRANGQFNTFSSKQGTDFSSLNAELELAKLRRYVLIIVDREAPPDAYVAYRQYGYSYYIAGGDLISRKNLSLLSQIMTMQAIPSASPALTPTINVGAQ
jgi:hypothetical protein